MVSLAARRYAPSPADRRHAQTAGLHPLLSTAAIAVTVASLAVTGSAVVRAWNHANESPVVAAGQVPITSVPMSVLPSVQASTATAPTQGTQRIQAAAESNVSKPVVITRQPVAPQPYIGATGQAGSTGRQGQQGQPSAPASTEPTVNMPSPQPAVSPATSTTAETGPAKPVVKAQAPIVAPLATVIEVREVAGVGEGTGIGAVGGGVLGAVLGSQIGKGKGRTAAGVLGALGGAYAGHEAEKRLRGKQWETTLRLDDGSTRIITSKSAPNWRVGDKVPAEHLSRQEQAAPADAGQASNGTGSTRSWGSEA